MKSLILLLFLPASIATSSSLRKIEDETSAIVPVKHITDVSTNTNSNIITSSFEDQMDEEIDFLDEEDDALLMNDGNNYDNIDDVQHNNDDQQQYFEIRSMIHFLNNSSNHDGWCLKEAFQGKKKNLITAAVCDGSPSQKWLLDDRGLLHNQQYPNNKCLKRTGKSIKVDACSTTVASKLKWMKWIISSDGTIRFGYNALLAIAIPEKFTSSNMLNRKVATVTLMKLANRFPKFNEQWMPVFPEPETLVPSPNPTAQPTIRTTVYPTPSMTMFPTPNFDKPPHNNPGNETSDAPFMSPNFPTPSHTSFPSPNFNGPPDDNPGNETSDAPFMSPNFPTPSHTSFPSPNFNGPPDGNPENPTSDAPFMSPNTSFPSPNFNGPPDGNPENPTSDAPFMSPNFPTTGGGGEGNGNGGDTTNPPPEFN